MVKLERYAMKTKLLKQKTIDVAAVAVMSLLAACATTSASQAASTNPTMQPKSRASSVITKRDGNNENQLTAREIWGWESLED